MNNPKISIIVPCYKVEQYLPTCIESIQYQTYAFWELILVDDGSPDLSGAIAESYAKADRRIKVIHKPNGGLSSARNAGLEIFTGDYVTFVDSDDFLHPDAIKTMINYAQKYEAQIVQCNFVRGNASSFPDWDDNEEVRVYDNHSIFTQYAANIIMCGKLYQRETIEGLKIKEGIINEDDWTTWKLYYKANWIVVTNRPLYYYTLNPNSIMAAAKKKFDTTYYGAYDERTNFFKEKGEKELEDASRIQFCKSLLLSYTNKSCTHEQRKTIKERFCENWNEMKRSNILPTKLKIVFGMFRCCPWLTSTLARKLQ